MLHHDPDAPNQPERVIVLGSAGFVGGRIAASLEERTIPTVRLTRADIDLCQPDGAERLADWLAPRDVLVFAAAKAPVRNTDMMVENMILLRNVVTALQRVPVAYVLNISSDAVYADNPDALTEESVQAPRSQHGVMHLAREIALEQELSSRFGVLRPTLIYGPGDPHNGYGPNRFARLAGQGAEIVLFGAGEERRDHVCVDDVAALAVCMILKRSAGALNAATGRVLSFHDIAGMVVEQFGSPSAIRCTERVGDMPHGGSRPFDPAATFAAFPGFTYARFEDRLPSLRSI